MEKVSSKFWKTSIIKVRPNSLIMRGYRIEDLIGRLTYGEMVYLMIKGELPPKGTGKLMDAILIAGCDHGASSPAIAAARMAATCGVTLNCSIATGINMLGDIHGGAVEQAMKLYYKILDETQENKESVEYVIDKQLKEFQENNWYVPGFGHGTHTKDPRSIRVFQLAEEVKQQGLISGNFLKIAKTVEVKLLERYKKLIAINIDGSIAAVACELGFPWQVGKGLFCLSRIIGITAHAYEESQSGYRIKTVMPPEMWEEEMEYDGPEERDLPPEYQN